MISIFSKLALTSLPLFAAFGCGPEPATPSKDQLSLVATDSGYSSADTFFIPVDSATKMMSSYLSSVSASAQSDTLQYWKVDAAAMRRYLADPDIKDLKIGLAHDLDYINAGNNGISAGFSPRALTIVVTGYDSTGSPVYFGNNLVLDRAKPCPPTCF